MIGSPVLMCTRRRSSPAYGSWPAAKQLGSAGRSSAMPGSHRYSMTAAAPASSGAGKVSPPGAHWRSRVIGGLRSRVGPESACGSMAACQARRDRSFGNIARARFYVRRRPFAAPQLGIGLTIRAGGAAFIMGRSDAQCFVELVPTRKVTRSHLVPTMFSPMLSCRRPSAAPMTFPRLRS
jgi:hypothetical protein